MDDLHRLIIQQINQNGPMPLGSYMQLCLQHPKWGYYTRQDPFGAGGDFITAPEISQIFGETIALGLAQTWMDHGAPQGFILAELGPGRGTLMADILRVLSKLPDMRAGAQVYLLESSPVLRAAQAQALMGAAPRWIDNVTDLPDLPLFFVANEFFDALPIAQYQRTDTGWAERRVAYQDGKLQLGLVPCAPPPAVAAQNIDTGQIIEDCPTGQAIAAHIGAHLNAHGGAGYIIDYGDWVSQGDTFQALSNHGFADPFAAPGQADLTAHVDFAALATASGCGFSRLTTQGVFLERLGITARAQALAQHMTGAALDAHIAAHRRLTHPDEMGQLFKVLGLCAQNTPPPAGVSQ
jgi:SAM-dependent MidA family methyltransferase